MQLSSSFFTAGSVLSRTFSILKQNPVVFFTMTVISIVPGAILDSVSAFSENSTVFVFSWILNIILALVIQGAIAYAVFMVFRGGPAASITETLSKGMVRPGPLFLAAIFMGMGILIAMFVLIFPGIMLLCRWAVTIPACAVEGLGPIEGMKRSAELTNGYCGTVFGLALIIGVITWMTTIGGFLLGMSGMNSAIAGRLLSAVLSIPPITFNSVMYAVIYYDLRMIKESVSIDRLANVFD